MLDCFHVLPVMILQLLTYHFTGGELKCNVFQL